MNTLTHQRLTEVLAYDELTGLFTWKVKLNARAPTGSTAGKNSFSFGYRSISIDGKQYRAARLAWFYVHGAWPSNVVDHINGNRSDDRIANLRDVTQRINVQNYRKAKWSNKSGYLGVDWKTDKQKWRAQIRIEGKKKCLGYYNSAEDAHAAYVAAKREHHEGNRL